MRTVTLYLLFLWWLPAPVAAQVLDLANVRIVDLTHAYDESTLYWPTSPSAFDVKTLADGMTPGGYYYSSYAFYTPEHGGTHLDLSGLDQLPLASGLPMLEGGQQRNTGVHAGDRVGGTLQIARRPVGVPGRR